LKDKEFLDEADKPRSRLIRWAGEQVAALIERSTDTGRDVERVRDAMAPK